MTPIERDLMEAYLPANLFFGGGGGWRHVGNRYPHCQMVWSGYRRPPEDYGKVSKVHIH